MSNFNPNNPDHKIHYVQHVRDDETIGMPNWFNRLAYWFYVAVPFIALLLILWSGEWRYFNCKPHQDCYDGKRAELKAQKEALARGELDLPHKIGKALTPNE